MVSICAQPVIPRFFGISAGSPAPFLHCLASVVPAEWKRGPPAAWPAPGGRGRLHTLESLYAFFYKTHKPLTFYRKREGLVFGEGELTSS